MKRKYCAQGRNMKIAVSGKGGVGKTLIAAALARGFAERGLKTMAIDADSSPNLALTLGLSAEEARRIVPISENKELVESKTSTGYSGVFRLSFTVDDIVREYSVSTPLGVSLIVMGTVQSMGSGCMCASNAGMKQLFLVGNRVMNETQKDAIKSYAEKNGLSLLAFVPFDPKVTEADMRGETPLKHKEIEAVRTI